MSPVFRPMCCYSVRVVRHWYSITGCSARVRHTQSAAHASLCRKFMAKLRSFTVWAEAEARWESGRLPIRKAVSDTLRSIRPRDPDDESPLCKTRRAVSPIVPEVSAGTSSSMVGSSVNSYMLGQLRPMFRRHRGHARFSRVGGHLYCRCRCRFRNSPTRILFQSVLVATQPYPSSPESRASTLFLPRGPGRVTDMFRYRLIESVVQLSQISALSSVQLSPNRVREDYTYDIVDVFPVFQVSPDTAEYLPTTSPVTPPDSGSLPTSLIPPDPDSLPPGGTGSFDSLLGWQSLIEQATDMSLLSPPLIPLPDDLLLLPMPVPMVVRQSPREPLTSVVSSPMDLFREGPFDAFCVPSDTGSHPLISEGLPGCPYHMTSYQEVDLAPPPPTFPRVYRGTRVSSVFGSFSGRMGPDDG